MPSIQLSGSCTNPPTNATPTDKPSTQSPSIPSASNAIAQSSTDATQTLDPNLTIQTIKLVNGEYTGLVLFHHWPNGHGKITYKNGNVYEGCFKNGWFNNYKSLITFEGDTIERHWTNDDPDHPDSYERRLFVNGDVCVYGARLHEGIYYYGHGKFSGHAKMIYANGDVCVGNFVNGAIEGQGKYTFTKGSNTFTYEGTFVKGKAHGSGSIHLNNSSWQAKWTHGRPGKNDALPSNLYVVVGNKGD